LTNRSGAAGAAEPCLVTLASVSVPVVFLHGFAATASHWDRVIDALPAGRFTPIPLNLTDADPLSADGVTRLVHESVADPFVLAGYSMGGRLALHTALKIPERVTRLVLISTSAGIEDDGERAARAAADEALAEGIERGSISSFVERWRAVPLFASDPDWVHAEVAADERRCTPAQLAASLRALGSGTIAPMWERLRELSMPVAVLAGEEDAVYADLGRRLAAAISDARFQLVPSAGHRVALQAPRAVVRALDDG
jgi:2-succinyl-6-hydroxy-2,4-cyclohexadiene-1-carboxylate synthase